MKRQCSKEELQMAKKLSKNMNKLIELLLRKYSLSY